MRSFRRTAVAMCALMVLLLAGPSCSSAPSKQIKKAEDPAILEWRREAERGDPSAQASLGDMYHVGLGVAQDYAEALRWYRKAAEQDNPNAQEAIGAMYERGHGVAQDYAEALRWYRKAAEHEHPDAQFYLGIMYEKGHGVAQDYAYAYMWLKLSASNDDAGPDGERFAEALDRVAKKMTPEQIAEGQRRAQEWISKNRDNPGGGPIK